MFLGYTEVRSYIEWITILLAIARERKQQRRAAQEKAYNDDSEETEGRRKRDMRANSDSVREKNAKIESEKRSTFSIPTKLKLKTRKRSIKQSNNSKLKHAWPFFLVFLLLLLVFQSFAISSYSVILITVVKVILVWLSVTVLRVIYVREGRIPCRRFKWVAIISHI